MAWNETVVAQEHKRVPTRGDVFFVSRKENHLEPDDVPNLKGDKFLFTCKGRDCGYWKISDIRVATATSGALDGSFRIEMDDMMELSGKEVYPPKGPWD